MRARLILLAHGSRRAAWGAPLEALTARLAQRIGADAVTLAYLDLSVPSLLDAARAAAADGVTRLRVMPLFLSGGGHVAHDVPPQIEAVRAALPNLDVVLLPPLGEHPLVLEALCAVALGEAD